MLTARLAGLNAAFARFVPADMVLLAARVFVGWVFWASARTKVEGFTITDSTYFLFDQIYALPLIPSAPAAVLATLGEHVFAALLVLGLASRLAALGLLIMTLVIQLFVFPEAWGVHGLWAVSLLAVMAWGPGRLSLDRVIGLER